MLSRWKCSLGHVFEEDGDSSRTIADLTCPTCGDRKILPDESASLTYRPAEDFDLPPAPRSDATAKKKKGAQPAVRQEVRSPAGYAIGQELGRGGMAVVYQAEQLSLQRIVALKMLLSAGQLSSNDLLRLHDEAEAVARLKHANIVQIYEVGEYDGCQYLSLEFVSGGTLDQLIKGHPQSPKDAAKIMEILARTVQFAHEHGVVHRDLKPSNILLETNQESTAPLNLSSVTPKISDFGLAKRLDVDQSRTRTGVIMGTPGYMAPEQAQGMNLEVGPAVDVYALGAILYELLTGRPPFRGETALDTIQHLLTKEPVAPSRLQPGVPRDLETICLKCLQKMPSKRYLQAVDLADDLRRFLNAEPILARPVSLLERTGKWARRRPAAAALIVTSFLTCLAMILGGAKYNHDLNIALADSLTAEKNEKQAREEVERNLIETQMAYGLLAGEKGNPAQAALWFANAAHLGKNDPETAFANRLRIKYWSRAAPITTHVLPLLGANLRHAEFHPQGQHLLVVNYPGQQSGVRDLARDVFLSLPVSVEAISEMKFSPDGRMLAVGSMRGELTLLTFPELQIVHREPGVHPIITMEFSHDNKLLAIGDKAMLRIWDAGAKQYQPIARPHPAAVMQICWRPGDDQLTTACADGQARTFAMAPGSESTVPLFPSVPHLGRSGAKHDPIKPLYVKKGQQLLTLNSSTELMLRDARTGKTIQSFVVPDVQAIVLSADESQAAICGFKVIHLLDLTTRRVRKLPSEHRNTVFHAAFSPDGSILVASSGDRTLSFWSVAEGKTSQPGLAQMCEVTHLLFSPAGETLMTRQADGLIRLLSMGRDVLPSMKVALGGTSNLIAMHPQGSFFISIGTNLSSGVINPRVFDAQTGEPVSVELTTPGFLNSGTFSSDGKLVALCGGNAKTTSQRSWNTYRPAKLPGWIQVWNWSEGKQHIPEIDTASEPLGVACSPDGRWIVAACASGDILMIDPQTGQILHRMRHGNGTTPVPLTREWVCFSSDSTRFLTWGLDQSAILWDVTTRMPLGRLTHQEGCSSAAFSPDGQYCVTASRDHRVGLWNARTGEALRPFLEHPDWVFHARFSSEGQYILTACRDHSARIWNWRTGKLACPPLEHDDEVFDVNLTRDGRWAITASRDSTARIWDARSGKPVSPSIKIPGSPGWGYQVAITPDNSTAIITGESTFMKLISLRELTDRYESTIPSEDKLLLSEIISGQSIHAGSGLVHLTTAEWLQRWNAYQARYPQKDGLLPTAGEQFAWHQQEAERLEAANQWRLALPHLDLLIRGMPQAWDLRSRRARIFLDLNKYEEALVDLDVALEVQQRDEKLWRYRGSAYTQLKQYDRALKDLAKAIELNPDRAYAWNIRGIVYFRQSNWEQAWMQFKKASELKPDYPDAWHNRGAAAFRMAKYDDAIASYTKVTQLKPDDWLAWGARGEAYLRLGELSKAAADAAKSLEIKSRSLK